MGAGVGVGAGAGVGVGDPPPPPQAATVLKLDKMNRRLAILTSRFPSLFFRGQA